MSTDMRDEAVQKRVCTYPAVDKGQTDDCGNMAARLSNGHGDAADGDQTDGCRHSEFGS